MLNSTQGTGHRHSLGSLKRIDSGENVAEPRTEARRNAVMVLEVSLVLGLVAGFLELGLAKAQRALVATTTMSHLRTNLHANWMIPVAEFLIFGAVGSIFAFLAWKQWIKSNRVGLSILTGMLALALLARIDGLYLLARLVLSLGIAYRFGPMVGAFISNHARLRRAALAGLGTALLLLVGGEGYRVYSAEQRALSALPAPTSKRPNVLFLVMDNVRAASTSLNGYDRSTTPNLQRLAERGIRFEEARSTAPWTLPSHASMFTGQWHHRLSVGWDRSLDGKHPTLAEYLGKQGYETGGFVGNIFYCNRQYGLDRGFAHYEDYYENQTVSAFEILRSSSLGQCLLPLVGYSVRVGFAEVYQRKTAELLNRDLLNWLTARPGNRPFFAFVNYYDAHAPCVVPKSSPNHFGHSKRPEQEQIEDLKRYQRLGAGKLAKSDGDPKEVDRIGVEVLRDSYESCISYIDNEIGELLTELDRRGLLDDTLIVVTSDHGEHFKEHGFMGHGQSVYRHEVHVPLLIVPPMGSEAIARPSVSQPVSLRDLPSTIVNLLGVEQGAPFPGQSLAPLWNRSDMIDDGYVPAPVLSEVGHKTHVPPLEGIPSTQGEVKALISEDEVYISSTRPREELFDLRNDPLERNDLTVKKDQEIEQRLVRHRALLQRILDGGSTSAPVAEANAEEPGGPVQR